MAKRGGKITPVFATIDTPVFRYLFERVAMAGVAPWRPYAGIRKRIPAANVFECFTEFPASGVPVQRFYLFFLNDQ
jgi:hypothetical protein